MQNVQYSVTMALRGGSLREEYVFARSVGQAMKRVYYILSFEQYPESLYGTDPYIKKIISITHK